MWDFQQRGGEFRRSGFGHTVDMRHLLTAQKPVWPKGGNFPVLWDFWPKRGDRFLRMGICGINSKRGGF